MTTTASEQTETDKAASPTPAQPAPRTIIDRVRAVKLRTYASALGGMVLGTLVGIAVNKAVATTGILGPGVSTLIEDQRENFAAVNERLEALRASATGPEAQRAIADLRALLQKQSALAQQSEQQLRLLAQENADAKDRALAENGVAGGADFWLKIGESFNLGSRDQVFALQNYGNGAVLVNLSGTGRRLNVGDVMDFTAGERACKVFYKQAAPREDGRVGFDLVCD